LQICNPIAPPPKAGYNSDFNLQRGSLMNPFIHLIIQVISLYNYVLIAWVILGLLSYFNIINPYQPFVRKLSQILDQLVEPVLRPIRKYVPMVGGVDLSPIVLVLGLQFITNSLIYYF
jgi:YggT family protein